MDIDDLLNKSNEMHILKAKLSEISVTLNTKDLDHLSNAFQIEGSGPVTTVLKVIERWPDVTGLHILMPGCTKFNMTNFDSLIDEYKSWMIYTVAVQVLGSPDGFGNFTSILPVLKE
jgi:hypothetical protein